MDAIRHRAICLNLATHIESLGNGHSVVFHSTVGSHTLTLTTQSMNCHHIIYIIDYTAELTVLSCARVCVCVCVQVIARRKEDSGKVKVLLHWTPEDM